MLKQLTVLPYDVEDQSVRSVISGTVESPETTRKRIFLIDRKDKNLTPIATTVSNPDGTWEIIAGPTVDNGNMFVVAFDDSGQYNAQVYDRVGLDSKVYPYAGSDLETLFGKKYYLDTTLFTANRISLLPMLNWQATDFGQDIKGDAKYAKSFPVPFMNDCKTFILDILDNWGYPSYVGLRSIDFYNPDGELISYLGATTTDTSRTVYVSSQNNTTTQSAKRAFDTSLSKVGTYSSNSWFTVSGHVSYERISCVFTDPTDIGWIVINNFLHYTSYGNWGVKNCKIYLSETEHTSTTYGDLPADAVTIFDDILPMHIVVNAEDNYRIVYDISLSLYDSSLDPVDYDLSQNSQIQTGSYIKLKSSQSLFKVTAKDENTFLVTPQPSNLGFYDLDFIRNIHVDEYVCLYGGSLDPQVAVISANGCETPLLGQDLDSVEITENLDAVEEETAATMLYFMSFDNKETYKVWTGTAWRAIATTNDSIHGDTGSETWHYQDDEDDWTEATDDSLDSAINSAIEFEENQMDVNTVNDLTTTEYETTGGFDSDDGFFDIGIHFSTTVEGIGASVDSLVVNEKQTYFFDPIDLEFDSVPTGSFIGWSYKINEDVDFDSDVAFYAMVTGTDWTECTHGGSIPGIVSGVSLTGKKLYIKTTLPVLDDETEYTYDPALFQLTIKITSN